MFRKIKILLLTCFIFGGFFVGNQAMASNGGLFNFQVMPQAKPCEWCGCDTCYSLAGKQKNDCLKNCIDNCKKDSPSYECKNNSCYNTTGNLNKNLNTNNNVYQCSNCNSHGDCTLVDFLQVFVNIADIILVLSGIFGMLMMIYNGFMFLISMGDPGRVKSGLEGIKNAFLGIVVVFTAWTIVGIVQDFLGFDDDFKLKGVVVDDGGNDSNDNDGGDTNSVGCCIPIVSENIPPLMCVSATAEGVCDDYHTYEPYACDHLSLMDECEPMACKFETNGFGSVCGAGAKMSCEEVSSFLPRESCDLSTSLEACRYASSTGECFYCNASMIGNSDYESCAVVTNGLDGWGNPEFYGY